MKRVLARAYPDDVIADIVETHLRVNVDEGALYAHALQCVRNAFEAAEDYTNRIIVDTVVEYRLSEVEGNVLRLPTAPVTEVVVEGRYADKTWHPLKVELVSGDHIAYVELDPSEVAMCDLYKVEAQAGYNFTEVDGAQLPGAIRQAVMLMAGTFFEFTADNVQGSTSELPTSAKALLHPYRIYPYGSI